MPIENINEVINFLLPIPSIKIQQQTSKQLAVLKKNTDDIILKYELKLEFIEDLKKSILQKAFSGALTSPERTRSGKDGSSPSPKTRIKQNPERVP